MSRRRPAADWPRVVAAPDKFRFTATAAEIAAAIVAAAEPRGRDVASIPMADGGEGTLDALARHGGFRRRTTVAGPLGDPVAAEWLLVGDHAYIEMARASGLDLVGGADGNDPLGASTYGTGELILAAVQAGAKRVVVTLGGSATTDGGFGALRALEPLARLKGIRLEVACDVETTFLAAAPDFARQKGASPAETELLRRRLDRLADMYLEERNVDVRTLPGGGAAGGLAGGLASIGARLVPGFDLVAEAVGLERAIAGAELVVTGEGQLDEQSFRGKVVGGTVALAAEHGVPVLIVVGDRRGDDATAEAIEAARAATTAAIIIISLTERFGRDRAWDDPCGCIREVVGEHLDADASSAKT